MKGNAMCTKEITIFNCTKKIQVYTKYVEKLFDESSLRLTLSQKKNSIMQLNVTQGNISQYLKKLNATK